MAKLRVGDRAPEFELDGTGTTGTQTFRLADLRGNGVILAFYPGDFTPVCTRQFCSYRDDGDRLEALGVPLAVPSCSIRWTTSKPLVTRPSRA